MSILLLENRTFLVSFNQWSTASLCWGGGDTIGVFCLVLGKYSLNLMIILSTSYVYDVVLDRTVHF
jgi:hypothetical protein